MLDSRALNAFLDRGRALQEEINTFIKLPTAPSARQLTIRIDSLINDIKPQLLEPSSAENNELGLLIASLGSIVEKLNRIKTTIKIG